MTLTAGTILGRYEIRSQLGAGGMGEVYLAYDSQLERSVALKILPSHLASDERRMRRFAQEAKAVSALNHPNIITIHEVGMVDSVHFIVTELIDGVTLRHLMSRAQMTLRETFDIVIQIASAIMSSHAAGIVHRDIKPENIMLRSDGYVKVLDFGLAKLAEETGGRKRSDPEAPTKSAVRTDSAIRTDPGVVMGTFTYMSPEQARGLVVDGRTDVWSLGVVLYEILAGRPPFKGMTTSDVIAAILEREPQPLTALAPNTPAEFERIVSKALSKDVEDRYQTVKDLQIDLRHLKRKLEVDAALERSVRTNSGNEEPIATDGKAGAATTRERGAVTSSNAGAHSTSNLEYIASEIKRHKMAVFLVALVLIGIGVGSYLRFKQSEIIDSVAILPFINRTGDAEMDVFSDGITVDLTNHMPELNGLRVVPHTTALRLKGQGEEPRKIGESLGVRAVLTGQIDKRGDTLIVSIELIDVENNAHVWGEEFAREQADILGGASFRNLQEEMSKQIMDKLRIKLKR